MPSSADLAAMARAVIDANPYMVLGTADETGSPWVSPVYFAQSEFREYFWVSSPEATHSRNLVRRPEVSIVIFNSQVPIGEAEAVYMTASAEELAGSERVRGIEVFSRRSLEHGARPWSMDDVQAPAPLRLYRASASAHYVLGPGDRRLPVSP
jgi:nitroimidazol reductase NimA-like FMN-containing flavoprotein (pyridoxamine 5'-phosphate oxidase superfamily)